MKIDKHTVIEWAAVLLAIAVLLIVALTAGCDPPKEKWTVVANEQILLDGKPVQHVQCKCSRGEIVDLFMTKKVADELYPLDKSWMEYRPFP